MADYTRLIEFKVKDTDLNRAVNKLGKTLDRIDKSLVGIDKKLDHIAKQGFNFVAKEANKAERSVGKLGKTLKSLSSPQGLAGAAISKGFNFLGGGKGEIARRVAELGAFDGALRKITNGNTGLPAFNRRVTEAATALAGFGIAHAGAITGIAAGGVAIVKGTELFYNLGKGVRQAEANLIDFIKTSQQVGLGKSLRSLFPKAAPGSRLGGADSGGMAIDGAAMQQATQLTGQSSRIVLESLRSRGQALANNKKIQENLVALTGKHLRASVQVKKSQFQYNLELTKTRLVQAAVTADIWAAQKAWQGVIGTLRGAGNLLGGLLGGKQGSLGQAAGVIGITRTIEALTGRLGFLNKAWIDNTKAAAHWTSRVTEAVTTVGVAYTGLTSVLGAASWTIGAIAGFKKWESEAAQTIWRLDRQVKSFSDGLNAMWMMLQGKGGTPQGVAQNLKDMMLGGEERQENIRFAGQGPTELQNLQRDLALQEKKLKQRNINESDYVQTLQKQRQIKQDILKVEDQIKAKQVEAGEFASKVYRDDYKDFKDQVDKKKKAVDKAAKDATKLEQQESRQRSQQQREAANNYEKLEKTKERRRIKRHKDALKAEKELANAARRRQQQRRDQMGRIGENLMLGAGFPMLFGGGAGAVGGGVLGAGVQAATGSRGFGAQILFSAVGQQIDAFAAKAVELGKALQDPTEALSQLTEMGIKVDESLTKQVESMVKAGNAYDAQILVSKEVAKVIGRDGVMALKHLGIANEELTTKANKLRIKIMSDLAPAFMVLIDLAGKFVDSIGANNIRQKAKDLDINAYQSAHNRIEKEISKEFGFWATDESKAEYWRRMTEASKGIIRDKAPGYLGNESGMGPNPLGKGLTFDTPVDLVGQKDLKILNQRINLLKTADTLTKDEILDKKIAIINSETDLGLQKLINEQKGEGIDKTQAAIILKNGEIKILELQKTRQDEINQAAYEANQIYRDIGMSIRDGLVEGINAAIDGTKTLGEVASNVFKRISNTLLNYGIDMALMGLTGGTGGFFGKALGYDKRAAGGPVKGGSPYIVGEKGPELFVPGSSGNIVPNHEMGGANIVVNVDASGSEVEGNEGQAAELGRMLGAAIQAELIREKRPGGLLAGR